MIAGWALAHFDTRAVLAVVLAVQTVAVLTIVIGALAERVDAAQRDGRRLARVKRLEGKHVVVTGAGPASAARSRSRLAEEGARLTLLARDESRLHDVVPGATVTGLRHPRPRAGARGDRRAARRLVANAGIGGPNEPGDGDRWDDIVQTNLFGTYWCCRAAEPHLPDGGRIVVTSSILARIGVAGLHGVLRVEGRAARPRAGARRRARAAPDPGERDLPRLGEHRDGVAGPRRVRGPDRERGVRGRRCARCRCGG